MEGVSFTDAQTSTPIPAPVSLALPRQASTPTPTRKAPKNGSASNKKTAPSSNKKAGTPAVKQPRTPSNNANGHRASHIPMSAKVNKHVKHATSVQTSTPQPRPVKALPARSQVAFVAKGSLPVRFVDENDRTLQQASWDNLPVELLSLKLLLNEALDLRYSQEIHLEHQRTPGFFMPVVDEIDYRGLIERLALATSQQIVRVLVYNKTDGIPVTPVRTPRALSHPLTTSSPSTRQAGQVLPQNAALQGASTTASMALATPSLPKEKANAALKPVEIAASSPVKEVRFQPLARSSLSNSITAEEVRTQSEVPEVHEAAPKAPTETSSVAVEHSGETTKKRKRSSEDVEDLMDVTSGAVPAEKAQTKKQKVNEAGDSAPLPAQTEASAQAVVEKKGMDRVARRRQIQKEELKKLKAAGAIERDLQLARQIEREGSTQTPSVADSEEGDIAAKMRKRLKREKFKQRKRASLGTLAQDSMMDDTMDDSMAEAAEDSPVQVLPNAAPAVSAAQPPSVALTLPTAGLQLTSQSEVEESAQALSDVEPSLDGETLAKESSTRTKPTEQSKRSQQAKLEAKKQKRERKKAERAKSNPVGASVQDVAMDVTLDDVAQAGAVDDNPALPAAVLDNTAGELSASDLPTTASTIVAATSATPGTKHRKRKDTRVPSATEQSAAELTENQLPIAPPAVAPPSSTPHEPEVQSEPAEIAVNGSLASGSGLTSSASTAPTIDSIKPSEKKSARKDRKRSSEESATPAVKVPSADTESTPSQKGKAKARLSTAAAALAEWRAKQAVVDNAQPIAATEPPKPIEVLPVTEQLPVSSAQSRPDETIQPAAEESQLTRPPSQQNVAEVSVLTQHDDAESEQAETPPASSAQIALPRSSQRPARLPSSSPESYPSDSEESQDAWQKAHRRMRTPGSDDLEPEGDDDDDDDEEKEHEDNVLVSDPVEHMETNKSPERPTPDVISSFPAIPPASMEIDDIVEDERSSSTTQQPDRSPTPQASNYPATESEAESADEISLPKASEMTGPNGTPNLFSSTQNPIVPPTQTEKRSSFTTLTDLAAPTSPIMPSTGVVAFQDAMDEDAAADQAAMDSVTAVEETSASDASNSNDKSRVIPNGKDSGLSIDSALSQSVSLSQKPVASPRRLRSRTRDPQSQTEITKPLPMPTPTPKKKANVLKAQSQPVSTMEEPVTTLDPVPAPSPAPSMNGNGNANGIAAQDSTPITNRKERRIAASQSRIPALSSLSADALRKGRASRFSTAVAPTLTNLSATQPNPTRPSNTQGAVNSDTDEEAHDDTDSDSDSDDERQDVTASLPADLARRVAGGQQPRKSRQSLGQMQGW